jgi:hypothetical protein
MRNFLRWFVLVVSICVGAVTMYFSIYYGWIAATPVQDVDYYRNKGNVFFYIALGTIGIGILGFIILREKKGGPKSESSK